MDPRYIVAGLFLGGLIAAFFLMFRKDRYRVPGTPLPARWHDILKKRVRYYRELSPERQEAFGHRVQAFLEVTSIVGAGTTVSLEDKLLVAASAEIPLFGFPDWRYPNLDTVILHPRNFSQDFDPKTQDANVLGLVGNRELSRCMVLSKPALHKGFARHTEHNVGIHEFTHLIDMSDGAVDGTPDHYLDKELVQPWVKLMHREMAAIRQGDSDIDPYAATNEAEFLAVSSEYFFTQPEALRRDHAELFEILSRVFRQNPIADNPVLAFAEEHDIAIPVDEIRQMPAAPTEEGAEPATDDLAGEQDPATQTRSALAGG